MKESDFWRGWLIYLKGCAVTALWCVHLFVVATEYIKSFEELPKKTTMGALSVAVAVLAGFEVGYFVKTFIWVVGSKLRARINPLDASKTYGKNIAELLDSFCYKLTRKLSYSAPTGL